MRILPVAVMLVLLALAVESVRWTTVPPAPPEPTWQPAVAQQDTSAAGGVFGATSHREQTGTAAAPAVMATDEATPPKLLDPQAPAHLLPAAEQPLRLVLTTGFPTEQSALDMAGPSLSQPSGSLERLPLTGRPAFATLSEMPIVETKEAAPPRNPFAQPKEAAAPAGPARETIETPPPARDPAQLKIAAEARGLAVSPLATSEPTCERSDELEQVARQADRQIRHGYELAGRSAYFAARSEFVAALRLVAEGLDTEQETAAHSRALAAALMAIKEADDFLPGGARLEADLDMAGIVAGHTTPVLRQNATAATAMTALKCYFTFAQQQFGVAGGHEVAASMALRGLGKLHCALAEKKGDAVVAAQSKAMVFYQAALLVYPRNYMAANDLGVLLAQGGNYAEARTMLEFSLSLCRQAATWQNLGIVYRQLGQAGLAGQADQQAALLGQADAARRRMALGTSNENVRLLDPQSFAQTSTNIPASPGAITPPAAASDPRQALTAGNPPAVTRPTTGGYPLMAGPTAERTLGGPSTYQNR